MSIQRIYNCLSIQRIYAARIVFIFYNAATPECQAQDISPNAMVT